MMVLACLGGGVPVEVSLLGRVAAVVNGRQVEPSGVLRKGLLAVLALSPGQLVSSERLVDALWGEHVPDTVTNSLQSHVSYLRRVLGDRDAVTWRHSGYVLTIDDEEVDATRAEKLIRRADHLADPRAAVDLLRQALALWQGPALADVRGLSSLAPQADRLDALHLHATRTLLDARADLGESVELVPELEQLVIAHPLDEGLHARLMSALYRAGRQSDALAAFRSVRSLLARELGVRPGVQLRELEAAILRHDPALDADRSSVALAPPSPVHTVRPSVMPVPLSSFVGRERETATVVDLVRTHRLVTVLGPGGVGKTRLAIEACRVAQDGFELAAFADLSTLTPDSVVGDKTAIVDALLEALGVSGGSNGEAEATLHTALTARSILLVVDNCEHVLAAAAMVLRSALTAAPSCHVLATSREPLSVPGESCVPITPLEVPSATDNSAADLLLAPAMQLLVQRARSHDPYFAVTPHSAASLAELCRRLDGMPLAVELAAARLRLMSSDELMASMAAGYPVLTSTAPMVPERHRSLDGAVRWSYSLLTEPQQAAFRAACAFRGGGALDAIAHVCRPDEPFSAAADLVALVDKSLLHRDPRPRTTPAQPIRLDAHETIARVGRELLASSADGESVRRRHAHHVAALLRERGKPGSSESDLRVLNLDAANVHAAIEWGAERDPVLGLELAGAAWWFWFRMGHADTGRQLLARLLTDGGSVTPARCEAVAAAAYLAWLQDDFPHALDQADWVIAQPAASPTARAMAFGVRSRAVGDLGDFAGASSDALRSMTLYDTAGDTWGAVWSRRCAAMATLCLGDTAAAQEEATACLDAYRLTGDAWGEAGTMDLLAAIAHRSNDHETALALAKQAVALHRELGDQSGLRYALQHHAEAADSVGESELAVRLATESLSLGRLHGYRVGMLQALLLLADIAARQGNQDVAAQHAGLALDLAEQLGDESALRRARTLVTSPDPDDAPDVDAP